MPVTKYRKVEDMPRPAAIDAPDLAARIRTLWARAFLLCPPSPPRGVTRFRSIEEANAHRERATLDRMRQQASRSDGT